MPVPVNSPTYFSFNGQLASKDNSTLASIDNNLVMCGSSGSNISLIKISKSGTLIWRNDFYAGSNSYVSAIAETSNQELFSCGTTSRNYPTTETDILLIKTNSAGDTIWTKTYGGTDSDYGHSIIATSDGNLLLAGKTESFGAGSFGDFYLIKLNTNGDTLWTRTFPDQDQEIPYDLLETQNGEFLITGTNEDNSNPRELYLVKVNSTGSQVWSKKIGPATWKWGFSTIELSNGDLLTSGQHSGGTGYSQVLLVKTDNLGNVIWEREFGDNLISEKGNSIKENSDGTFSITGSSFNVETSLTDIILLKVDQNGDQLFLNRFGTSTNHDGVSLIKDTNDDNIITGNYNGNIFMTKTDNNGVYR